MPRLTELRRRVVIAAVAMPALLSIVPATAGATTPEPTPRTVPERVCDFDWQDSKRQVKLLIRCAAKYWGSPGGVEKALDVARCESGYNTDAYNPGGYAGVYQHAVSYWPDRADKWGFPDRSVYNGRANIIVSIRMANSANSWGLWGCA